GPVSASASGSVVSNCHPAGSAVPSAQIFIRNVALSSPTASLRTRNELPAAHCIPDTRDAFSTVPSRWTTNHTEPSARCQTSDRYACPSASYRDFTPKYSDPVDGPPSSVYDKEVPESVNDVSASSMSSPAPGASTIDPTPSPTDVADEPQPDDVHAPPTSAEPQPPDTDRSNESDATNTSPV